MLTRDHMDLGCSICKLGAVGAAHIFHSHNIDPDRQVPPPDDRGTPTNLWPNFHSGANGDAQRIEIELPVHLVMRDPEAQSGTVMYLPAHPHEGAVEAPVSEPLARVIATSRSLATGNQFNIAVAFERSDAGGPAIAESTFHQFADYNWDPSRGCPDFVTETPGDGLARESSRNGISASLRSQRRIVARRAVVQNASRLAGRIDTVGAALDRQ